MTGIIAAIYASFILAIGETSLKKSFRDFEPSVGYFVSAVAGLILLLPAGLILGGSFSNLAQVLPYAIMSAVLSEALYFYALSKGQLSITAILLSTYPVYTIFFSHIINDERIAAEAWPFVGITIFGTLLSYLPSKLTRRELVLSQALVWPIIAAIAAGLADTVAKSIINQTSAYDFLIALAIAQVPISLIYLRLEKLRPGTEIQKILKAPQYYFHALSGGLMAIIGTSLLWVAFNYSDASIISPIVATSGGIIVLLAALFLDERLRLRNGVGVALMLAGVIGITFTT